MSPRRAKVLGGETSPGALRRHLIAVTQHLLAAHGATKLTTRQIAREAQVADGVLYNHFADKDDLVLTALVERAGQLADAYLAAIPAPGTETLEANLRSLVRSATALHAGMVPLITGLIGHQRLLHGFFTSVHDQSGPQAAFSATVAYVRGEQALGRASADVEAEAVGELLFGACQLRALLEHLQPPNPAAAFTREAHPDAAVAVLLRALRPD